MKRYRFEDYDLEFSRPCLTIGMFDGVHLGHRTLLKDLVNVAQKNQSQSIVVTFTKHPREVLNLTDNGFALLQDNERRAEAIESCGVDCLLWLDFKQEIAKLEADEFLDMLIERVNPQMVLLGYDNRFGKKGSSVFDEIIRKGKYKGIRVERSKEKVMCEGVEVSSTQIRKALLEGNVRLATKMLSVPYLVKGEVVGGRQIGRKIGFPTANVNLDKSILMPKEGVYAVRVWVEGEYYKGVANLGAKPTIDKQEKTFEVHIFDFSSDIYNKVIEVEFISYLRQQRKFETLEELKQQIERDCEKAREEIGRL